MNQQRLAIVIAAIVILGVVAAFTITGCEGCRPNPKPDEAKKDEPKPPAKPVEDFYTEDLKTYPSGADHVEIGIKPQHWTGAELTLRANHFDFQGDLTSIVCDRQGTPLLLDGSTFRVANERPVVLPKAQTRTLQLNLFAPQMKLHEEKLRTQWNLRGGGVRVTHNPDLQVMEAHQYHLLVLAQNREEYRFLHTMDSIRAPSGLEGRGLDDPHYRVVLLGPKAPLPLPSNLLQWTTISTMIWDDRRADDLSPEQRQAIIDWLHWGGQLIVSGPNTLDALRGSFLEPYLSADPGSARQLDEQTLSALANRQWTQPDLSLSVAKPWVGVELRPRAESHILCESGDVPLLVERRVGRGRVVVSAFRLAQRDLVEWKGYDALLNAVLLRRGPRAFKLSAEDKVAVNWHRGDRYDPALVSNLRFFTRDDEASRDRRKVRLAEWQRLADPGNSYHGGGWSLEQGPPIDSGVAGWNDSSAVSKMAQETLRAAAGIVVPESWKVAAALGAYVFVLVPLNWLVFRILRRVEYAWFAAPVITLAFTVIVVKLAALDIGFARTQREVTVVEVQGRHPRAHVTHYDAFYSSLGTDYDLHSDDTASLILPFPTGRQLLPGERHATVTLSNRAGVDENDPGATDLEGLVASSSTTLMVHGERMVDLGGAFELERLDEQGRAISLPRTIEQLPHDGMRYRFTNGTQLKLDGAWLVWRNHSQVVGNLEPGQSVEITIGSAEISPAVATKPSTPVINLRHLLEYAEADLEPGELRLLAWNDEPVPGFSVQPAASQRSVATLVVAHLQYGHWPAPERDNSSRAEIIDKNRDKFSKPDNDLPSEPLPAENPDAPKP